MAQKRMRVFAGPNGSGKTTIITDLKNKFSFGVYVNADDIESSLAAKGLLNLNEYNLQLSTDDVQSFFKQSELSPKKNNSENYWLPFIQRLSQ